MITKKLFIETIEVIKRKMEFNDKFYDIFKEVCDGGGILKDSFVIDHLIQILHNEFGIVRKKAYDSDIEYFIYDLDFGTKWTSTSYTEKDGTPIDISTSEKLYDYLVSIKNENTDINKNA